MRVTGFQARRSPALAKTLTVCVCVCACLCAPAPAALVDRVLVIRNAESPVSRAVADDYAARRGARHVLDIHVPDAAAGPDSETLPFADFRAQVEEPLKAYLDSHPGIDFILMTKGVPICISGAQRLPMSLDSYVAAMGYDSLPGAITVVSDNPAYRASDGGPFHGVSWFNRFWNSRKPFTHAEFGGYLVTRLDGYTQADAIALTTRSLAAESALAAGQSPKGLFLLDQDPSLGSGNLKLLPFSSLKWRPPVSDTCRLPGESTWGDFNTDMFPAADTLRARHYPFVLDTTLAFLGHREGLMGYASWGSNDRNFDPDGYASLRFAAGSICETAVSTSARTFLPTEGGQSLIADLITAGVTGVKGYVDEPWMEAIASPSILFGRYTEGWTLAESFYAASNEVGWKDIIIGDPILRAYPSPEIANLAGEGTTGIGPGISVARRHGPASASGKRDGVWLVTPPRPGSAPVSALGRASARD